MHELIIDNFAGGGGASTGIELALGRSPDFAINHDARAVCMHEANHPDTVHLREDVFAVDPVVATGGRPVGLAWFSPDCTHFSKAKGGKPKSQKIRGLAWVMIKWITAYRNAGLPTPRVCVLENVEEFKTWGPLLDDGSPCKVRKGKTFKSFIKRLTNLGYEVQWRELVAADYGAPTSRKRFFLIARCDGQPIVWPAATHGKPNSTPSPLNGLRAEPRRENESSSAGVRGESVKALPPWRTAAECIDWSLPCHSIFLSREEGRKVRVNRPLAAATMRRIARGMKKFVFDAKQPFIVPLTHQGSDRIESIAEPMRTVTCAHRGERALVTPFLTEHANASSQRIFDINEPMRTQCAQVKGGHFALCAAFLAKHFSGEQVHAAALDAALPTVTARDHHSLVTSNLMKLYGTSTGQQLDLAMPTVTASGNHLAEVRAFFVKYYGDEHNVAPCDTPLHTVTTKERMGLITVAGQDYAIADIGMRMLKPRELFNGQGFPADYIITPHWEGKPLSEEAQVRLCGNSVCPPVAQAIVAANVPEMARQQQSA